MTDKLDAFILPFSEINKNDIPLVGGKGANLGEMTQAGFPVPNGFCLTAKSYQLLLTENDLHREISKILEKLDIKNNRQLESASKKIQKLILSADVPLEITNTAINFYRHLKPNDKNPLVAVRSSATAEDLPDASFAGQQQSFLNIKGESNLLQAIRQTWASLFEARAIFYRETKGFDHSKVSLAIPIQLMIQSDISGVAFSTNPLTNNKNQIVIEAIWGLGDYIVQGVVSPDKYLVDKNSLEVHSRQITPQDIMEIYRHPNGVKNVPVPKNKINQIKLTDKQIVGIASLSKSLQDHYFFPQDSEWAVENNKIYLVQTRPITTLNQKTDTVKPTFPPESIRGLKIILRGQPASIGIASGPVQKIKSKNEINLIKNGDILVTSMTSPDFVPAMKRAAGIITDKGGQTSHAAIVSREMGTPAIVGAKIATKILKNREIITLNGATGDIFAGSPVKTNVSASKLPHHQENLRNTATKVYVNLGEPELAGIVAQGNADGVGLLRAEFMIAQIGIHPKKLIHDGKKNLFVDQLTKGLSEFTQSFGVRPVIYRATDLKTNEYRGLKGGAAFEPEESNPMLGFRGAYRYITDPQTFELELEAIKNVRNKMGYKNLWLMIPFIRTVDQLIKVKQIISSHGLNRSDSFKLWMMVEIPSNVILLDEFLKIGLDGVSIGSNDLTMLILGTDRDNEMVAPVFNELDPAVLWALEKTVKTCVKSQVTCSLCGQAASFYPELVRKLVAWGITSVSVSPDAVDKTRELIYQAEKRILNHG